ncbi:hypothetical protein HanXRQr2_Chr05g0212251 [Helianthus annuus]|uniref:Uncharacterized protein n=1 Tax=Helianthus annuus TaxID=4232 RepID=A0A9K3J0Y3_HELAN|nr:hypothetical protein HanXRQr2_Chr05g0212251 [Helianthus annuus]KAJ0570068.1 hypothetical protein HanHA300_Chr05g0173881 [Helianthus annuus]KAJ0576789.1 hypothetical protein HanIR_Chr05g0228491 [Helianthus annuus]KAJ0584398.1 hypothetical protein HanHA89_Chr05g0188171 [Helianthus annuus]KAJ0747025.1 hypothetical protein HanOQP8_Chr05g0184731 [Helianthus annuus]
MQRKDMKNLKVAPPLECAYVHWLAKDQERILGHVPTKHRAVKPRDHYIEYMRMDGWLDLDLTHLFN